MIARKGNTREEGDAIVCLDTPEIVTLGLVQNIKNARHFAKIDAKLLTDNSDYLIGVTGNAIIVLAQN